jgi:hypothetical protein
VDTTTHYARLAGLLFTVVAVGVVALWALDSAMAWAGASARIRTAAVFTGCNLAMVTVAALAGSDEPARPTR